MGFGVGKQSKAQLRKVKGDYILSARKTWPVDTDAVIVGRPNRFLEA